MDSFKAKLERERKRLGVYMTHTPRDDEYMPVLSYRVDTEIARTEQRLEELKALRDMYSA
jgi:hypothetical protein